MAPSQLEQAFRLAAQQFGAGNLTAAEEGCRRILTVDRKCVPALQMLGAIALRKGDPRAAGKWFGEMVRWAPGSFEAHANLGLAHLTLNRPRDAVKSFQAAIRIAPTVAGVHNDLGNALRAAGQLEVAARSYETAVRLRPGFAEFHVNLGQCRLDHGQADRALECFRQALALDAGHVRAWTAAGIALAVLRRFDAAESHLQSAIRLDPRHAAAHTNLGLVLSETARPEAAAERHREALRLKPDYPEAMANLGAVCCQLGRFDEAERLYRTALAARPDHALIAVGLGDTLRRVGKLEEAQACLRQVLRRSPDCAEAHAGLGLVLHHLQRYDEAEACHRAALRLRPDLPGAHHNLALALIQQRKDDEAIVSFRRALELRAEVTTVAELFMARRHICDWDGSETDEAALLDSTRRDAGTVHPSYLLGMTSAEPADQLRAARAWAEKRFRGAVEATPRRERAAGERLRLGYLSPDFYDHPVSWSCRSCWPVSQVAAQVFELHDRGQFEVVAYSNSPDDRSPLRDRVVRAFDRFVDIRAMTDADAAARIAADGIDILVDLAGHTTNARTRVLAHRPAPLQVNFLGYPGTVGSDCVDAIIVDRFIVPPERQPDFAERLVHLPDTYFPHDRRREIAQLTPSRAECGLPAAGFVFCAFNIVFKITPTMFDVWMRLLRAVPDSVLWLRAGRPMALDNLRREAASRGIDPDRLVAAPRVATTAEHLARHRLADLFLDSFPFNAHTTASDALWSGLPVLTLAGNTFASRVAGSLLHAVGLPELITTSLADYEALALRLATEPGLLDGFKRRLAAGRDTAPLFDSARFTRNLEAAYRQMWETL
ncbi:MAG: tetratricopeptide repeat protein [Magnetospirillum sp.]|nr:tetratricopeptide repeat protein [Magnetospirillum sp.]